MRRATSWRAALRACIVIVVLCGGSAAYAAVRAEIVVIHATVSQGKPYVDPALAPLADLLRKSFGSRFTAFRHLSSSVLSLPFGQPQSARLPNERELTLTLKGSDGRYLDVLMELQGLRTTVRIRDGGMFFQAGHAFQGGMLVLAITVRQS